MVKIQINEDTVVAGMYISPQTKEEATEKSPEEARGADKNVRTIIAGDLNARYKSWDRGTNPRGRAVKRFALRTNLKVSAPQHPSYTAKG